LVVVGPTSQLIEQESAPVNPRIILKPHWQSCYVTTDIERAEKHFGQRYGIPNWLRMYDLPLTTLDDEPFGLHLSQALVGDTCLELIQPFSGADQLFRHGLPEGAGFTMRLHHHGMLIHDEAEWQNLEETVAEENFRPVWRTSRPEVRVLFIDTYAELGHYIEYLYYFDKETIEHIPRN